MNTFNLKVLLVLLLLMGANGCSKSPLTQHDWGEGIENFAPARLLSNADGRYNHWQSIARVKVDEGRICSGSLIDTRGANDDRSGPAYVLTSGHCAKGNVGRFIVNEPASGQATFNFFRDTTPQQKNYPITRIAWSTLRGQDIALLVLDRTLGQVMNDGIQPLKVASHALTEGTDTLVVGAAVDDFIQRSACPQEHRAGILEAGWVWVDQISNRCLGVINGISGSPLLNRYTNEIVAVIGTTTRDSGRSRCSISAPCEVIEGMPNKARDTNYATPANGLDTCFRGGASLGTASPVYWGPCRNSARSMAITSSNSPEMNKGTTCRCCGSIVFRATNPSFASSTRALPKIVRISEITVRCVPLTQAARASYAMNCAKDQGCISCA